MKPQPPMSNVSALVDEAVATYEANSPRRYAIALQQILLQKDAVLTHIISRLLSNDQPCQAGTITQIGCDLLGPDDYEQIITEWTKRPRLPLSALVSFSTGIVSDDELAERIKETSQNEHVKWGTIVDLLERWPDEQGRNALLLHLFANQMSYPRGWELVRAVPFSATPAVREWLISHIWQLATCNGRENDQLCHQRSCEIASALLTAQIDWTLVQELISFDDAFRRLVGAYIIQGHVKMTDRGHWRPTAVRRHLPIVGAPDDAELLRILEKTGIL